MSPAPTKYTRPRIDLTPEQELANRRWTKLVRWWERRTRSDLVKNPERVPDDYRIQSTFIAEEEIRKLLKGAELHGVPVGPNDHKWMLWPTVDSETIDVRRKLHNKLAEAARAVLTMRQPLEKYEALMAAKSNSDYVERLMKQGLPRDNAFWDMVVSPETWRAAYLLATMDNPYPVNPRGTQGYVKTNSVKSRRSCVHYVVERL